MAYYGRYEDDKRKDGKKRREEKRDWDEEKDYDEEKDWYEEEEDYDDYDKCRKEHKKPCFSEEKKCKFEIPLKVIVKVVPIDDDHRRNKKHYD